ncbi:unnamed protein product [Withania somnifera]
MEGGGKAQKNNKPLDVFNDFKGQHAGLIKALTTDVEELFKQCDPEKENLCLYGLPNERWAVNLPAEDLPLDLPEPVVGINFARDGTQQKDWLSFVAYHMDAWLLAVAVYAGARFGFGKADRSDWCGEDATKGKSTVSNQSKNKSKPNASKRLSVSDGKFTKLQQKYEEEDDDVEEEEEEEEGWDTEKDVEEEQGETLCGTCGEKYTEDEFWICCDSCEAWFHGQCVKITTAQAEFIKQYKCPHCNHRRSRT